MTCALEERCGGCCYRQMTPEAYREMKEKKVRDILVAGLGENCGHWQPPIFLPDGTRRRAAMAFAYDRGQLKLGFNRSRSFEIVDCVCCPALTPRLNALLPGLRLFLEKFCALKNVSRTKKHKIEKSAVTKGDLLILEADNGADILLETENDLSLDQRLAIFDYVNNGDQNDVIRFSHRRRSGDAPEPVAEKLKPVLHTAAADIYPSAGTFLQASKLGEAALIGLVCSYLSGVSGEIADLFCGIGTFSYPLARLANVRVTAVDVDRQLLDGLKMSVNRQMIHNIEIIQRNLFKYPLEGKELSRFDAVVFDPPRAGAAAQVRALAALEAGARPRIVVAVSCNPHSFVNDAKVLIGAGYKLEQVTMVDQFVYSNHSELVALFTS